MSRLYDIKVMISKWIYKDYKRATLYCLLRGNDKYLNDVLRSLWDKDKYVYLIEPNSEEIGDEEHRNVLYNISFNKKTNIGFFAMLLGTVDLIDCAKHFGYHIKISWGENTPYYDVKHGENVFNYFYEPICELNQSEISGYATLDFDQVIVWRNTNNKKISYIDRPDNDQHYAELYKKYFVLNKETEKIVNNKIQMLFGNCNRIIGVHVRGTDYKSGYINHPLFVPFETYIERTKDLLETGKYDRVFIATDDKEALELFTSRIGDKLIYYSDCFRSSGNKAIQTSYSIDMFQAALNVLVDAYTLASCNALVCSLSNVSTAARVIKKSKNESFEDIVIVSNRIKEC